MPHQFLCSAADFAALVYKWFTHTLCHASAASSTNSKQGSLLACHACQTASAQLLQAWSVLTGFTKSKPKTMLCNEKARSFSSVHAIGKHMPHALQNSSSSASLSGAAGQSSGGTDYLKSALEAAANQKETFFARKMEVRLQSCHFLLLMHQHF